MAAESHAEQLRALRVARRPKLFDGSNAAQLLPRARTALHKLDFQMPKLELAVSIKPNWKLLVGAKDSRALSQTHKKILKSDVLPHCHITSRGNLG